MGYEQSKNKYLRGVWRTNKVKSGNPHFGMIMKSVWFDKVEFNKLINAIESNQKDEVFEIMFAVVNRGDL